jgi:hypothetical protein
MGIVRDPKKNRLQPRRGGRRPVGACHAAPTGLKTVVGVRGYKHGAPPELESGRIRERQVAGANLLQARPGFTWLFARDHRPGLPEPKRWTERRT